MLIPSLRFINEIILTILSPLLAAVRLDLRVRRLVLIIFVVLEGNDQSPDPCAVVCSICSALFVCHNACAGERVFMRVAACRLRYRLASFSARALSTRSGVIGSS